MSERTMDTYGVFNPEKADCPISRVFNNLYRMDTFQNEQQIPTAAGMGYGKRYVLSSSKQVFISDATFYEDLTMREKAHPPFLYSLAFCLDHPFQWWREADDKEYQIDRGECCMFDGMSGDSWCTYHAGKRFFGLSVQYDLDTISGMTAPTRRGHIPELLKQSAKCAQPQKTTPNMQLILNDIIHCRYEGTVKKIYLEGKALELLAVYLDELVLEHGTSDHLSGFSAADIQALHQAREMISGNTITPPTIGQLSRLVCLNECKLKSGFRELFGMPIHAYIIDKRMELARLLMMEQGLTVSEAAVLVGYSNTNYFTKKFKVKYGLTPSEYRKT